MSWSPPDVRRAASTSVLPFAGRSQAAPRWPADLVTGLMTAAVVVLLGAPTGLLWAALAPHVRVVVQGGKGFVANAQPEVFIAGDGWFMGITLAAGICTGVLGWLAARRSGPYVVVGLAVGGALAAFIASRVGVRIGQDELLAVVGAGQDGTYAGNVVLKAKAAIVAWPLGAMAAFTALVVSRADELE